MLLEGSACATNAAVERGEFLYRRISVSSSSFLRLAATEDLYIQDLRHLWRNVLTAMRHLQATYLPGRSYQGILGKPFVDCTLYKAAIKVFGRGFKEFFSWLLPGRGCMSFQVEDVILFPFGIGPRQLLVNKMSRR